MIKHAFSDFSYAINNESAKKGHKEILVCFIYNGVEVLKKVYIPEGDGIAYIFEAKKVIDKEMRNGSLTIYSRKFITKKKKEAAKKKRKSATTIAENNAPVAAPLPTPPGNHTKKWVAITAAIAAVALVGAVLGTYYGVINSIPQPEPPAPPEPVSNYNVHFLLSDDCVTNGSELAPANKNYSCGIFPKNTVSNEYEVQIFKITMGDKILRESEGYKFENGYVNFLVPTTADITIVAQTRLKTFNVYYNCEGCHCTSVEDGPFVETVSRNYSYSCKIIADNPDTTNVKVLGVAMGGKALNEGDDGYVFHKDTSILEVKKVATNNIVIVAVAEPKEITEFDVYAKVVGGTFTPGTPKAHKGSDYVCHITPTDQSQNIDIVSVSINNIPADSTKYSYSNSDHQLTIDKSIVTGEIFIAAISVDKPASSYNVNFYGADTCTSDGEGTVDAEETYSCNITPVVTPEQNLVPRIISITMGGTILTENTDYTYTVDPTAKVLSLSISKVAVGVINIYAIAEAPTTTSFAAAVVQTGCTVTASAKAEVDKNYSCTIQATDPTNYTVTIVEVLMKNTAVAYTYVEGVLTVTPKTNGDIVILAVATKKEVTTFRVDWYLFGCEQTGGAGTVNYHAEYAAKIKATDATKIPSLVIVKNAGTDLVLDQDYTWQLNPDDETKSEYILKINEGVITGDIAIDLVAVDRTRDNFNVTCYQYNCVFSGNSNVQRGVTNYEAEIAPTTAGDIVEILSLSIGSVGKTMGTDYEFNASTNKLSIKTAINGDVVICATSHPRNQYEAGPAYNPNDPSTITGISMKESVTKDLVTDVVIPTTIENSLTNAPVTVTSINAGILNGCSSIETVSLPFIGAGPAATQTKYSNLFGHVFGSEIFDNVTALTWQDYYAGGVIATDNYVITKAAIPNSLVKVTITGGTVIPEGAFSKCRTIENVNLSAVPAQSIGAYAFNGCNSLKLVNLHTNSVQEIGVRSFQNCSMLQTLSLTSATTIKQQAFENCSSIRQITIPSSVIEMGDNVFTNIRTGVIACQDTRSKIAAKPNWKDSWVDDMTSVIYGSSGVLTSYISGDYRFIIIKDDNNNEGAYITEYLGSVTGESGKITIPQYLTATVSGVTKNYNVFEIGSLVFYNFTAITEIDFTNATSLYAIGNYAFTSCGSLATLTGLTSTKLATIGNYAFDRCEMLYFNDIEEGIKSFPNTLNYIGTYAFAYCGNIAGIDFSNCDDLIEVRERLFYDCAGLKKVILPDNIIYLGKEAFLDCSQLTDLTLGVKTVDTLPDSLCQNCEMLENFTWTSGDGTKLKTIGNYAFDGCAELENLKFLSNATNKLPSSLVNLGNYAFRNCASLSVSSNPGGGGSSSLPTNPLTISHGTDSPTNFNIGLQVFEGWDDTQYVVIESDWIEDHLLAAYDRETTWGWTLVHAHSGRFTNEYHCSSAGNNQVYVYTTA